MKNSYYKPNDKPKTIAAVSMIVMGVFLFVIVSIAGYYLDRIRLDQTALSHRDELCDLYDDGTLSVLVTFDKEPIDFVLVSPSNRRYTIDDLEEYETSPSNQRGSIKTNELGTWWIEYNQKKNTELSFEPNFTPIPDEMMSEPPQSDTLSQAPQSSEEVEPDGETGGSSREPSA